MKLHINESWSREKTHITFHLNWQVEIYVNTAGRSVRISSATILFSDIMILEVGVRHIDRAPAASVSSLYINTNTIVTIEMYLIFQYRLLGEYYKTVINNALHCPQRSSHVCTS
jgi:hypothetical protein